DDCIADHAASELVPPVADADREDTALPCHLEHHVLLRVVGGEVSPERRVVLAPLTRARAPDRDERLRPHPAEDRLRCARGGSGRGRGRYAPGSCRPTPRDIGGPYL